MADQQDKYLGLTSKQARDLWVDAQHQIGIARARRTLTEKDWINILGQIKENGENYLGVALYYASDEPYNRATDGIKKWFKRYFVMNCLDNDYHFDNVEL